MIEALCAVCGFALASVGVFCGFFRLLAPTTAYSLVMGGALAALAVLVRILYIFKVNLDAAKPTGKWERTIHRTPRLHQPSRVTFVLVFVVLAVPLVTTLQALKQGHPFLNDVSTDAENPPPITGAPLPTRGIRARVSSAYPELKSLQMACSVEMGITRAWREAEKVGWENLNSFYKARHEIYLTGTKTSYLFGFVDDIVVRVTGHEMSAVVDVRSRSRVGLWDWGANYKHITEFLDEMAKY